MSRHASMNRAYSLVWNESQQAFVPVPETAKRRGKRSSSTVIAAAVMALFGPTAAHALDPTVLPTGGQVSAGSATIAQTANVMTINQGSAKAAIDWQTFSVGKDGTVNFVQPSAASVALNRVIGQDPTQIYGALHANGQVFIVNAAGVLFAPGAQVDAAGVVASTRGLGNADFMAGRYSLAGSSTAAVVNQGQIKASSGGYVVLVGAQVVNTGSITAKQGDVRLAAADQVSLKIDGSGLVGFTVERGTLDALAANQGLIRADGGRIWLTADALDQLSKAMVNNEGVIEAQTVENHAGSIVLRGDMKVGTVQVGGTLDASAPAGGDGGFIETSAAHIKVVDGHHVTTLGGSAATGHPGKTGTWLIDPTDFTIAAVGGDETGAQLSSDLASSDITIQSNSGATLGGGDIFVNDSVTWTANLLTLSAQRNIVVNASLHGGDQFVPEDLVNETPAYTITSTARLALQYGQGAIAAGNAAAYTLADGVKIDLPQGNNFSTLLGSDGTVKNYYVITALGAENSNTTTDLQGMFGNLSLNYAMGADIDASPTATWQSGQGLSMIGTFGMPFAGNFDGLGHEIANLHLNWAIGSVGLFGEVSAGSRIANVNLTQASIYGGLANVGALVGHNYGTVEHSTVTGDVSGGYIHVGGLVGNNEGEIRNSSSQANVGGVTSVGGLVGYNAQAGADLAVATGVIVNSTSSGTVSGSNAVGGLIGTNWADLDSLHSSASVSFDGVQAGGLIGGNAGAISNAYASGSVSGSGSGANYAGGLIGQSIGPVSSSHASGAVSGNSLIGGLIGQTNAYVSDSYATNNVSGGDRIGGLVGALDGGSVSNSSASGNVTSTSYAAGGLIGYMGNNTSVASSYAIGAVSGNDSVGGLVGRAEAYNPDSISGSYASGNVSGASNVGGLLGNADYATVFVSDSHASGNVTGTGDRIGGLVGSNDMSDGGITGSYATGNVVGVNEVGGLMGFGYGVSASYATGTVNGASAVGGLVGHAKVGGTISDSHATGTVTGYSVDGPVTQTGGLVGFNEGAVTGNSYATGVVSGNASVGGLVGQNNSSISNSATGHANVAGGSVTGTATGTGGLVGANYGSVSNSVATGAVAGADQTGGLVGMNAASISASMATGGVVGTTDVGGLVGYHAGSGASIANSAASGSVSGSDHVGGLVGTSDGAVSVSQASGIVQAANDVGGLIGHATASSAVTGSNASSAVTGHDGGGVVSNTGGLIGWNEGSVSGNSYATGVVSGNLSVGGLVGLNDTAASISDSATGQVNVAGGSVTGTGFSNGAGDGVGVGGLVGTNKGSISNGLATGSVAGDDKAGGLVGTNFGSIAGSGASGAVVGSGYVGGLVGYHQGTVTGTQLATSHASGAVTGNYSVGGLVGYSEGGIDHAWASGATSGSTQIGGLVGYSSLNSTTSFASATGNVSGQSRVGGFVGYSSGTNTDSSASGSVIATSSYAGGFAGYTNGNGTLARVSASGSVTGTSYVGGLVGSSGAAISNSSASGAVHGYYYVGGLVGRSQRSITASTASGNVSGINQVGGLAGGSNSSISGSGATGNVSASGSYAGGLVGYNQGDVSSSTAAGDVAGVGIDVGGLIGRNFAAVAGSSATGNVSGADSTGGLVGYSFGSITGSIASGNVAGTTQVGGLVGSSDGAIVDSHATTGTVSGTDRIGGLVGSLSASASVSGLSYASGAVSGANYVGGLVGYNDQALIASTVTASATVLGSGNNVGGLVGENHGDLIGLSASSNVTGAGNVGGLVGTLFGNITGSQASGTVASTGGNSAGGLVGDNHGNISASSASGSVTGTDYVGGLVGFSEHLTTVSGSSASGAVSGHSHVGGLLGGIEGGSLTNVSASGNVSATGVDSTAVGGLVGNTDSSSAQVTITGSFATGNVAAVQSVGGLVGIGGGGGSPTAISTSYATGAVTGTFSIGGLVGVNSGSISASHASGAVTGSGSGVGGLAGVNDWHASISDAQASGAVQGQDGVGGLVGTGNPYASVASSTASGAVSGRSGVGGLVGFDASGSITGSSASGNVIGTSSNVGGLLGSTNTYWGAATISTSSASGDVIGASRVGGLIGLADVYGGNRTTTTDSSATGSVSGGYRIGGLIGDNRGDVAGGSAMTGTVSGSYSVGGLVGLNLGTISNSHAAGAVSGGDDLGGLVGDNDGQISGGSASGTVTGTGAYIGGLAGYNGGAITAATAGGAVQAAGGYAGGLVGYNDGSIASSSASGAVGSSGDAVGGAVGYNDGNLASVSASGNVTTSGANDVGGLVGQHDSDGATITGNSSATGNVLATASDGVGGNNVGGAIGRVSGSASVTGVQASGTVSGRSQVGGFVGTTGADNNSEHYKANSASGAVSGTGVDIGGFVGGNAAVLLGAYGASAPADANTATGAVTSNGGSNVGGFAGRNIGGIGHVSSSNAVTASGGGQNIGGIVGLNDAGGSIGLSRSLNTVVADGDNVGGVAGMSAAQSMVFAAYAAGSVSGHNAVGGLIGRDGGSSMIAYSSAFVGGHDSVGGLIGIQDGSAHSSDVYASGPVGGNDQVGGLIGSAAGSVARSYATGAVTGASQVGGLTGTAAGATVTDSFYNTNTTGLAHSSSDYAVGGETAAAKTSAQMNSAATFASWDLATTGAQGRVWRSYDGLAAPLLSFWLTPLTITANGGDTSRVYDGTVHTTAVSPVTWSGTLGEGHVYGNASYAGRNAGTYTALAGNYSDQQGYDISYVNTGSLTITQKVIFVSASGVNKVYDGSTAAQASLVADGVIENDAVSFSGNASFANKNAGVAKAVTVSGISASGADAGNYSLESSTAMTTASITQKVIVVAANGIGKVYDGSTVAQANLSTDGVIENDAVSFSGNASFANKNAGVAKAVTVTGISASGADAGNYSLESSNATTTASITPKTIVVAANGIGKVYDGSTAAQASLVADGVIGNDAVSFSGNASFANKNAGIGKTVSVTGISASGVDAGNYSLESSTSMTTASITPRTVFVSASGIGKVYDGSTSAQASLMADGVIENDAVSFSGNASFANKNAGIGKTVSVTGISANGADAGNYNLESSNATTTASITPKTIVVAANGIGKVYDGSTAAQASLVADGVIENDAVSFSGHASFANKNAGIGKTVSVTGISANGADAGNYNLEASTATTTASITPKTITVAATGVDKVYDGSLLGSVLLASGGVVAGDHVAFSGSAGYTDKNAGRGKAVAVTGISDAGSDAANYLIANATAATTAAITPKAIVVVATASDKVYDGQLDVAVSLMANGVITGDQLSLKGSGSVANANAGSGKSVTVAGISGSGADAANYSYDSSASTTASVTPRQLSVGLTGSVSKTVNGSTLASLNAANYAVGNLVAGESVTVTQTVGAYADANTGTGKQVTVSLSLADYSAGANTLLGNYQFLAGTVSGLVGTIQTAVLPVSLPQISLPNLPSAVGQASFQWEATTAASASNQAVSLVVSPNTAPDNVEAPAQTAAQLLAPAGASVVSTNTRENLMFRRTFSIGDGGMRLPVGVLGSDKDTAP
jgi:filamentous hemagglutinin family protein